MTLQTKTAVDQPARALPTPGQIRRRIEQIVERAHPTPRHPDIAGPVGRMETELTAYVVDLLRAAAIPPGARDRLARHLYITAAGDDPHTVQHWDSGQAGDGIYRKWEQAAEAAIAAYEGRES